MKRICRTLMFAAVAVISTGIALIKVHGASTSDDPYAPLRLYDGKWDMAPSGDAKDAMHLENHCTKTGLFFVCEQIVGGKTGGLLVFLPVAKMANGGEEYRTQALAPDASPGGEWGKLTIEGDRWIYSWENLKNGKKVYGRTVNIFTGTDKIHFEVQSSDDGQAWKVQKSGDEERVK